jgi:hypothetical protein
MSGGRSGRPRRGRDALGAAGKMPALRLAGPLRLPMTVSPPLPRLRRDRTFVTLRFL